MKTVITNSLIICHAVVKCFFAFALPIHLTIPHYNDLWQQYSDVIEYAYRAAENQLDRAASLAEANLNAETRRQIADEEARTAAGSAIGGLIGTLGAAFITGGT